MDDKEKKTLERARGLLRANIILTDEFYRLLRTEAVLPDTMIRDVQSYKTQVERNNKLIDILKLRGGDAYRKFRHVLYLTGHQFLADFLYGEDADTKLLKAEEVFTKFQNVFHHISDDNKCKVLNFLDSKVKEKALTSAWLKNSPERCEILDARKDCFDTEKDLRLKLDAKVKKISHHNNDIIQLKDELRTRNECLDKMQQDKEIMKLSFKDELAKQTRFNAANNHSLIQLRDRFNNTNERVNILNLAISEFLDFEERIDIEDSPDSLKISLLEKNIRKLMYTARFNKEASTSSGSEKELVLSLLKPSSRSRQQPLSDVVRQYVDRQEKGKASLSKEIDLLLDNLRANRFTAKMSTRPRSDFKMLRTQLAIVREEAEHIKKKLEWKDGQISDLISENQALREQMMHRPQQTALLPRIQAPNMSRDHQRDSPDSSLEIEQVYQQFDRYMGETPRSNPPSLQPRRRRGSLADVNLERDRPMSPAITLTRRNSKIDASDLDILGTAGVNKRRRSLSSGFGSDSLAILPDIDYTVSSAVDSDTFQGKKSIRTTDSPSERTNNDFSMTRDGRGDPVTLNPREGRRPSLADLITMYEDSRDNMAVTANKAPLETVDEDAETNASGEELKYVSFRIPEANKH